MCKLQLWLQNSKIGQAKSKLMIYQEKSCSQQWNFEMETLKSCKKFLKKQKNWRNKNLEIFLF